MLWSLWIIHILFAEGTLNISMLRFWCCFPPYQNFWLRASGCLG